MMATVTNPRGTDMNAVLSTTVDKIYQSGKMQDQITNGNPTLAWLRQAGNVLSVDGGYQLQVNLMYGLNTTYGSYSQYDVVDVAAQDGITSAFFPWAHYSTALSISHPEEVKNAGAGKLVDLVATKAEQIAMTQTERMNGDIWKIEGISGSTTGNNGKNVITIPMMVCYQVDGTLDVGGIDTSSYAWWRNTSSDCDATTYVGFRQFVREAYAYTTIGPMGAADLIVSTMQAYLHYMGCLDDHQRYMKQDKVSLDFGGIAYLTASWFFDVMVPDAEQGYDSLSNTPAGTGVGANGHTAYFLNSKTLRFMVKRDGFFKPQGFVKPYDQAARTNLFLFDGNLTVNNKRKNHCMYGIQAAALTT